MPAETVLPNVFESIIDQINLQNEDDSSVIAFNNDHTPFQIVFYVLRTVVPMSDKEAYDKTTEIHEMGESSVYTGSKEHCRKIGAALTSIKVTYSII